MPRKTHSNPVLLMRNATASLMDSFAIRSTSPQHSSNDECVSGPGSGTGPSDSSRADPADQSDGGGGY